MRWLIFLLLSITLASPCAAGEVKLSLEEAVARALEISPQVSAGSEAAGALRELATSAGRLPDPSLVIGIDNLPVEGPDAWSTTADFMTMRNIGLMQEFPHREKRRLERERASADVGVADAELANEALVVARETARAWIRRSTAEAVLEELTRLRPDVELGATAARAAVTAGRSSAAEALVAASAAARLEARILEQSGEAEQARAALARWIGADSERPLGPFPTFDSLPAPAASLLAGVERHAAVRPFDARLAAARTDVELARADRRPDWSAELSYAKRGPDFADMASLRFTIGLPLFAKHRQDPVIAARNADYRRMEAERENGIRAHALELRQMLIEWEQANARLAQYDQDLLPLARERSTTALAAYRSGSADLRLAVDAYADEADLVIERAGLAEARARAWTFLRYLEPRQLPGAGKEVP